MTNDAVQKEYVARVTGDFRARVGGEEALVKKWVYVDNYKQMLHGCQDEGLLTQD